MIKQCSSVNIIIVQIVKPTKKNSQLLRREKMIENEFQEQYVLGLTNNQSKLFFAIATIELPKV